MQSEKKIAIIGAGFTGLTIGYYLAKKNWNVQIFEKDSDIGGLAGRFIVNGRELEKFYHHWFTNDEYITDLVKDLGLSDKLVVNETKTGMYFSNNFFKLSSPQDLLKFTPLNIINRVRLGLVVIIVRFIKNWKKLERTTAAEWLQKICGRKAYNIVWEPLLKGKFGEYAEDISAVWFWNKLKLRGGSRGNEGSENLLYFKGGFCKVADAIREYIESRGGAINCNSEVISITDKKVVKLKNNDTFEADYIVLTAHLPTIADILSPTHSKKFIEKLNKIKYIGNICLVLELKSSLSDLYWININNPDFPFVGIIEHTNFEPKESYNGSHIVYLSKYLPTKHQLYQLDKDELLDFALPFIQDMFPNFNKEIIVNHHLWKEAYSQPLVFRNYSQFVPDIHTELDDVYICTMAQIYPEDRGTNYAIRESKKIVNYIEKKELGLADTPILRTGFR